MHDPVFQFEDYEIEEPDGQGVAGGAYFRGLRQAENAGLGRRDLLFRVESSLARNINAVDQVRDQLVRSTGVSHANLLAPLRCAFVDNELILASEWLPGTRLSTIDPGLTAGAARWPIAAALHLALEVGKALSHLHSRGLVHGHVRPESVFVGFDGQVKILSLGMACAERVALDGRQGHADGVPNFGSPEQAAGRELDGRSDLFSLGALLWGLVAGRPLFPAGTRDEWARILSEKEPPPPSQANPEAPPELDAISAKLLDRDLHLRYELTERFVLDLAAVLKFRFPDFTPGEFSFFCKQRTALFREKYHAYVASREKPAEDTKVLESIAPPAAEAVEAPASSAPPSVASKIAVERTPIQVTRVEGPRPTLIHEPGRLSEVLDSRWIKPLLATCAVCLVALPIVVPRLLQRARAHRELALKEKSKSLLATLHVVSNQSQYTLLIDGKPAKVSDDAVVVPANRELVITAQKDGFEEIETVTALMADEDLDLKLEFRQIASTDDSQAEGSSKERAGKPAN